MSFEAALTAYRDAEQAAEELRRVSRASAHSIAQLASPPPLTGAIDDEAVLTARAERLGQAMIESTTEFNWNEIPPYTRHCMIGTLEDFIEWADGLPPDYRDVVQGEVAP